MLNLGSPLTAIQAFQIIFMTPVSHAGQAGQQIPKEESQGQNRDTAEGIKRLEKTCDSKFGYSTYGVSYCGDEQDGQELMA